MREPAGLCAVCGLSGFADAAMSYTEAGLTCPGCYLKWQQQQREQALEAERAAARAAHSSYRWRMIAVAAFALILVIVSNWSRCGR
jgi:hypothetical protein